MEAPETPADSPLTLEQAMSSPLYQRLMTPELGPGEPAYEFELPLLDRGDVPAERRTHPARRLRRRAAGRAHLRLLHLTALPPPVGRAGGALRPARRRRLVLHRLHPRGASRGRLGARRQPARADRARRSGVARRAGRDRRCVRAAARNADPDPARRRRRRGRVRVRRLARPPLPDRPSTAASHSWARSARSASSRTSWPTRSRSSSARQPHGDCGHAAAGPGASRMLSAAPSRCELRSAGGLHCRLPAP